MNQRITFFRSYRRTLAIAAMVLPFALYVAIVLASGTTADRVLGQVDFTHNGANLVNGQGLYDPWTVAIDASVTPNRLYVADSFNNRVLGWRDAASFSNGEAADLVIGQPDFTFADCNNGGVSKNSLCVPGGVAVDGSGHLYVGDSFNSRVLEYTNPFTAGAGVFPCVGGAANEVFGQGGSFTSNTCNNGGISDNSLCEPFEIAVDGSGHLYVADSDNNRVLEYNTPLTSSSANEVFGQGGSFTSNTCNNGGISDNSLCDPYGVALDGSGHLYVADEHPSRVLEYNTPPTSYSANEVFGQGGSFTSNTCNNGGISDNSLCDPYGVALDGSGHLYVADGNSRGARVQHPADQHHRQRGLWPGRELHVNYLQ